MLDLFQYKQTELAISASESDSDDSGELFDDDKTSSAKRRNSPDRPEPPAALKKRIRTGNSPPVAAAAYRPGTRAGVAAASAAAAISIDPDSDEEEGEYVKKSREMAAKLQAARAEFQRVARAESAPSSDDDVNSDDGEPPAASRPDAAEARAKMSIHVRDSDGSNFKFTTWADEPLETVMKHYCEKKGLRMGMGDLRFLVDGEKVPNTSTLLSHDLENEDIVDIAGSGVHV